MTENDTEKTQVTGAGVTQAIPSADATQMAVSIICPVCRTVNTGGERYCSDCGFLLTGAAEGAAVGEGLEMPAGEEAFAKLVEATSGREFLLNPGENTIGRENADVLLAHATVSRRHAKLTVADGKYILEDLGSTNGTFLGSRKVEPGQPVEVKGGDEITFGSTILRLEAPGEEATLAAAEAAREVEEAEEREEAAAESIEVEQAAEATPPPPAEGEEAQEEAAHEEVEAEVPVEPGIEAGFDATPAEALQPPIETVEIPEEEPPLARLVPVAGGDEHPIRQGDNTLGRKPANNIVVSDPYVSSSHAVIAASEGKFTVTDVGSTNGTLVNGERLIPNEPRELASGDEITLGQSVFRFEC